MRAVSATFFAFAFAVGGCSQRPPAFQSPDVDASAATDKAFDLYDKSQDGELDEAELAACPGVLNALDVYDANKDKKVSKSEMSARIESWTSSPAMMSLDCRVTYDGRSLAGAEVVYDPEPYLADAIVAAKGVTGADGATAIGIPAEAMSAAHRGVRALTPGVYKIRITHPTIAIPAIYNVETKLGREMSMQTRPSIEQIPLSSKP